MTKNIVLLSLLTLLFVQCGNDKDVFLITKSDMGHLTKNVKINQLDSIYAQDSVVTLLPREIFLTKGGQVEIYEKGGAKLLLLSPKVDNDPESKISNIQIFDERYKTEKGLTLKSTFKDLKDNYTISSIQSTMMSVVISLVETDVYVTIDRQVLPENVRNEFGAKIEATQIPDTAPFKYFMVGWEKQEEEK